jgi:hypothetical protein
MHTQKNNRAHALSCSQALPVLVLRETERHQRYLEHRMQRLRREARRLIARDPERDRRFRLMLTCVVRDVSRENLCVRAGPEKNGRGDWI